MSRAFLIGFRRGAVLLMLGVCTALPATADPLFTMEFVTPTGVAGVDEVIIVEARIEVAPGSDTIVFGAEAVPIPFSAGGARFFLTGAASIGDFFPDYSFHFGGPGDVDFTAPFAGLTLMPGEGVTLPSAR